jgi:hypothetical protein
MFTQTKWFLPKTGKSTKGGSLPANQAEAKKPRFPINRKSSSLPNRPV